MVIFWAFSAPTEQNHARDRPLSATQIYVTVFMKRTTKRPRLRRLRAPDRLGGGRGNPPFGGHRRAPRCPGRRRRRAALPRFEDPRGGARELLRADRARERTPDWSGSRSEERR